MCGGVYEAADYPWKDAFAWAETLKRERHTLEFFLGRLCWTTMYSPLASQGAKDLPDPPEPPDWME